MKKLFSWKIVLISLLMTVVTGALVNGPAVGTGYLQEIVPHVTIPDLTPDYSPDKLSGFFQSMGGQGREAYITVNNLDFLFIASNMLFGVSAFGVLLKYIMRSKALAVKLAFAGLLPGLFDAIESVCFRLIVMSPYAEHMVASEVAAAATKAKFAAYNMVLLVLFVLVIAAIILWAKRRSQTNRKM